MRNILDKRLRKRKRKATQEVRRKFTSDLPTVRIIDNPDKQRDPLAAILQIIETMLDNDGIEVKDQDLKRLIEEIKKEL